LSKLAFGAQARRLKAAALSILSDEASRIKRKRLIKHVAAFIWMLKDGGAIPPTSTIL